MPPSRCQQQTPSQKCKQKKKLVKKSKSVSATNKDAENIYEEIEDVKAQSASSSVNNSDSGIGGLTGNVTTKSLNSFGSSSASKSSSGSAGNSASKGTLDVSRPRHKKSVTEQSASGSKRNETSAGRKPGGIPLSSLDALISQTSPGLTPHQRLSLRKSLVDELFEELIQRHHRRVLDELRLDVEEFIAPSPDFLNGVSAADETSNSNSTPKSTRSSAQSSSKLHRCESMDFKDQNNLKKNIENSNVRGNNVGGVGPIENKKIGSKLWQSARKCTEVIQRKLKKSSTSSFDQQ